jgi:hypothetical protein
MGWFRDSAFRLDVRQGGQLAAGFDKKASSIRSTAFKLAACRTWIQNPL